MLFDEVIHFAIWLTQGEKVGVIKRSPVSSLRLGLSTSVNAHSQASVKKIAVLDRTKEPGSLGEPLYLDVAISALREQGRASFHLVCWVAVTA